MKLENGTFGIYPGKLLTGMSPCAHTALSRIIFHSNYTICHPCQIEQGIVDTIEQNIQNTILKTDSVMISSHTPITQTPLSNRHPCLIDTPVRENTTPVRENTLGVQGEQVNRLINLHFSTFLRY